MSFISDESWMRRAIALGRKGLGTTSPNPAVGAVLVKDGKLIGKGYHKKAGENHAEIEALNNAQNLKTGDIAKGATLFVTLEPCNHFGKTPPCTLAIINSGVARVVIATSDPNPNVKGGGAEALRLAGIDVSLGVCQNEANALIAPFVTAQKNSRPYVTLKIALTSNDKITTGRADENWLSSAPAKALVHRLRSRADCILVGKNTVLVDDPILTNRLGRGSRPLRAYLDSQLSIKELFHLGNGQAQTVCLTPQKSPREGYLECQADGNGRVDLHDALSQLFSLGVRNLLCEGGAELGSSLLAQNLVDCLILIRTPVFGSDSGISFDVSVCDRFNLKQTRRCGVDSVSYYTAKD